MKIVHCEKIRKILTPLRSRFGWEDFGYTFSQNKYWAEQRNAFVCEASANKYLFFTEYARLKLHSANPISKITLVNDLPQTYTYSRMKRSYSEKENQLFDLIASFGWKSGMSISIHGYGGALGLITLNHQQFEIPRQTVDDTISYLNPWLFHFNAWSRELLKNSTSDDLLTHRERECLQLVAQGKTSREIAEALAITKRTADFHVNNATQKLGCNSRSQAASLLSRMTAVQHGLVRQTISNPTRK
jgi:DNA-binding CsgD family transcriptional regulator